MTFLDRARRRLARWLEPRDEERRNSYFFVCGYPKSGTHWVANLINLHPDAYCHGELHLQRIRRQIWQMYSRPIYRSAGEGATPGKMRPTMEAAFDRLAREMLDSIARWRPEARTFGDHSPEPLHAIFGGEDSVPGTRYVHIVRDGRDVAVSWTFHWLRSNRECFVPVHLQERYRRARGEVEARPGASGGSRDARALGEQVTALMSDPEWVRHSAKEWRTRIEMDRETIAGRGARFWPHAAPGEVDSSRVLQLRYEQLHAQTQSERDRIHRFLGLDPAKSAPLSHETRTMPGFKQVNPTQFYRKGQIGDWEAYFGPEVRQAFAEVAGQTLIELGYETDSAWAGRAAADGQRDPVEAATRG